MKIGTGKDNIRNFAIYFVGVLFSRISQHAKIFNSDPDAWMRLVYAILVVQYTVHVQMSEWYWFLSPLLSSIANLTTRENVLKSQFAEN